MNPKLRYPSDTDLRRLLRFATDSGAIWLGERRMVLLHTEALSALRHDLIASVGPEHTRRLLTRMGYASGLRDAAFAKKTRSGLTLEEQFLVGPQLHMLEGAARVSPLRMEIDIEGGHFDGEFRWDDSWEAYAHRQKYGVVDAPACWTLLGYASGYTSGFMGRLILFKELACAACGAAHCHIHGRPIEAWPDGEAHRHYFEDDSLLQTLQTLSLQVEALTSTLEPARVGGSLIGASKAFRQAQHLLQRAASTQVTVLLTGETGVGKERFARSLHELSERAQAPFVAVNCAALPAELIEAELFGAESGAYTGATRAREGRFEAAQGGTLFLDEIGNLPLAGQVKLLRVLETGRFERLGSSKTREAKVRVLSATNADLKAMVAGGSFREDLYYRLNVFELRLPALAERRDDVLPLARHFLGEQAARLSDAARDALLAYRWPGNVRELKNVMARAALLAGDGAITPAHLQLEAPAAAATRNLDEPSREAVTAALREAHGVVARAAQALGLSRQALYRRMERYALLPDAAGGPSPTASPNA